MIDSHCHLNLDAFADDRDAVVGRAVAAGVIAILVPATTRQSWRAIESLGQHPGIRIALGLHPGFLEHHQDADLAILEQTLQKTPEIAAIGECGLDARFPATWGAQWKWLDAQLRLARQYDKPVVLHCVRANDKLVKRVRQISLPAGGVVHAFAGSFQQARAFLDQGLVLGLGGAITYPRAQRLRRCIADLPDDGYLLETDAPDMPVCGYQGLRNEPSRLVHICDQVAKLRGQSVQRVIDDSTANARRVLGGNHPARMAGLVQT